MLFSITNSYEEKIGRFGEVPADQEVLNAFLQLNGCYWTVGILIKMLMFSARRIPAGWLHLTAALLNDDHSSGKCFSVQFAHIFKVFTWPPWQSLEAKDGWWCHFSFSNYKGGADWDPDPITFHGSETKVRGGKQRGGGTTLYSILK